MGDSIKEGFGEKELEATKRDFKAKARIQDERITFEKIGKLIMDSLILIYSFTYSLVMCIIGYYFRKPKSLTGKVCFVTGSGRGLGREFCIALAKEGAIVACADINEETNKETVDIVTGMGAKAKAYKLNVANKEEVDIVAKKVESDLGRVYLVINNAAIILPPPKQDESYIRAATNVNILGPIWTTEAFLPKMKESREGHILNMSSLAAPYGCLFHIYGMTKAALTNYAQGLRLKLWHEGYENIFITTVHPSIINTSADYVQAMRSRLKILEEDEVVKLAIDSVKYNKTDVSTNPFVHFLLSITKFFPFDMVKSAATWTKYDFSIPSTKEYSNLPVSDIIKESSNFGLNKPLQT